MKNTNRPELLQNGLMIKQSANQHDAMNSFTAFLFEEVSNVEVQVSPMRL